MLVQKYTYVLLLSTAWLNNLKPWDGLIIPSRELVKIKLYFIGQINEPFKNFHFQTDYERLCL